MTITRIWETGFELDDYLLEITSTNGVAPTLESTIVRTGSRSLRLVDDGNAYFVVNIPASITQLRTSFHFYHSDTVNGSQDPRIFTLRNNTTICVSLAWNGTSMIAYVGGTAASTVVHAPFSATDTWFHISVDVKIANAGGWIRVYVDGVQVIDFSGDTDNGATTFNNAVFGQADGDSWLNGSVVYFDDIYLDDTTGETSASMAPDSRFELITPNGNGDLSQWEGSDGNSTDNYLLIDELPPDDDTTYIQSDTAGQVNTTDMTTFTIPVGWSIAAVIPLAIAKKDDAGGTLDLRVTTRLSSTDQESGDKVLGTDYAIIRDRHTSKPGGGAWTQNDLNSVEIGVKAV